MKKRSLLIIIFINFNLFSQISVDTLNTFTIKRVASKDALNITEIRQLNKAADNLFFMKDASKKKIFWPNGRPNKGTGYGIYGVDYTYECHWKNYKFDGKLTIKYKGLLVFEGTAKDGFISQGIVYRFAKYTDGLYRYPRYYGNFVHRDFDKKDVLIYYDVKGVKFFLENGYVYINGYGDFPHLDIAFGSYLVSDAYDSAAYKGRLYYYKNVAPKDAKPDWRLLYKFGKRERGEENIDYQQLHNYDTENAAFYNKQPKYYVKCPNRYLAYLGPCKVISTKTKLPIKFNPSQIIQKFIEVKPKDNKASYVYYDDEDWQKRLAFIAAEKAEIARIKKFKEDAIKYYDQAVQHDKELLYTSQKPLTYIKDGEAHLGKIFFKEKIISEIKAPIKFYKTKEEMMNNGKYPSHNDIVYYNADKQKKEKWGDYERLDGYFKGELFYTKDSITMAKGKFYTSRLIGETSISRGNLFYIGVVCSFYLFPDKTWSTILKSKKQYTYSLVDRNKLAEDGSLTFTYKDLKNKQIRVTVYPKVNEDKITYFTIKITVNNDPLGEMLKSMQKAYEATNKSQQEINKAMKEYNEKMKEINKNLEQINKEREALNKKKSN